MNIADFNLLGAQAHVLHILLTKYPEKDFIRNLKEEEVFSLWPSSDGLALKAIDTANRYLAGCSTLAEPIDIKLDFTRLFVGIGEPIAPPWGSVYLSPSQLINDESTLELMFFYKVNGIEVSVESNDPIDHVGLMMLVLSKFFFEMHREGGRLYESCVTFLEYHFLPWINNFLKKVETHSCTDFYKAVSLLTQSYLIDLYKVMPLSVIDRKIYV
ncbi:TorD/DmsD family molecular chaperone [Shewanella colwelliana]|uniref:TorD/DmsD family molecular chaperone n=1 Tax=Shewanella colwelliana TaxID=23 RepID=UPI0004B16F2B|nr:molecular chaperone TorD family protein [Shewanella colwelliana]